MLFKDYHIPLIREHEKTVTRRVWNEDYARPTEGSVQMAAASMMVPEDADHNSPMMLPMEECDCFIRIGEIYDEPLGEMTDEDARKEGDYENVEEFKESWIEINGGWDPEEVVAVVPILYVGTGPFFTRYASHGAVEAYHNTEDCPYLAHAKYRQRSADELRAEWRPCPSCIVPGNPQAEKDYDFSYQESLVEAAKRNAN